MRPQAMRNIFYAGPSGRTVGGFQIAERSLMRSACRVTLHNKVVLRHELIEGKKALSEQRAIKGAKAMSEAYRQTRS